MEIQTQQVRIILAMEAFRASEKKQAIKWRLLPITYQKRRYRIE